MHSRPFANTIDGRGSFQMDGELIACDGFGAGGVVDGGLKVDREGRGGIDGGGGGGDGERGGGGVVGYWSDEADCCAGGAGGADGD